MNITASTHPQLNMNIPRKDSRTELDIEIDFATADISAARIAARDAAANRLVETKTSVYHDGLKADITFTKRGIKECVNQPFRNYREKLSLIYHGLEEALRLSEYDNCPEPPDHPGKEHIVSYHYFETSIGGEAAFFNVQLTKQGDYVLYTITDSRRSNKKSAQRA
jgi:hypothetical protein